MPSVIQLELVEGTAATLPDGTVVNVKGIMYAHLPGSRNLSRVDLVVTRAGQTVQIGLAREHGGSASNEDATETALGWEFTIERADPYHRPSRATVHARSTQP